MVRLEQQISTQQGSVPEVSMSDQSPEQLVSSVERVLIGDPAIADCAVLVQEPEFSHPEFIAYIVPSGSFSAERSQTRLKSLLPPCLQPSAYVLVATLPLTPEGQVDQQALSQLAVLEDGLVQRWEEHLNGLPAIVKAAVVIEEYTETLPPLHLSDLIAEWQTAEGTEQSVTQTSADVPIEKDALKIPAIAHGTPLEIALGTPLTLPETLKKTLLNFPHRGLTYIQADGSTIVQSYGDLLEKAERILAGLRQQGLQSQDKVIFQFEQNRDFMAALWGCLLGGFIPVPVSIAPTYTEINGTVSKLGNAWQLLDKPLILTSKGLAPALHGVADLLNLEGWQVAIIDDLQTQAPDSNWHPSQPNDLALLLLTSGSTGMPKCVMLSHYNVITRSIASASLHGFSSEEITLNWMPLDHVAGLIYFHLRDVYLGCHQIHAPIEQVLRSPLRWLDWIEQYHVTVTFAPNFAYGLVNEQAAKLRQPDLSSLRCILNGGEAIVARSARQFLALLSPYGLPPSVMRPAWGMSETSSEVTSSNCFSLASTTDDDPFVDVGSPIPGFSMRIVDSQSQVVEEGVIGRLQVRGTTVTCGYYQNSKANAESFTADGWFITGDLAYLRDGRLTITGREKDIIIINGVNYYSHEIEAVVEELAGIEVSYTAACAVRTKKGNSDRLAIFFHTPITHPESLQHLLKDVRSEVVRKIGINPEYLIPIEKEVVPKTAIGKIQRTQLKNSFEVGVFEPILKQLDLLSSNTNTLPDWFYQKTWQPKKARLVSQPVASQSVTERLLIFQNQSSLGLGQSLQQQSAVIVEPGSEFVQLAADHYRLEPGNPEHYTRLLEAIAAAQNPISQVFHLWTYGESELQNSEHLTNGLVGSHSLLYLIQAIAKVQGSEHPTRLLVVSSQTQQITATDSISPVKALVLGIVKAASQEMAWLDCRHLDLSPTETAAAIVQEMQVMTVEREVAYRQGQRLIPRLTKVEFQPDLLQDLPFKPGGMYLISGGLGGVGVQLAQYLHQHYQAKLLLLGRTALPPQDTWETHLQQEGTIAERIRAYQTLKSLGGELAYEAVDVCEGDRLQAAVRNAESKWQCSLDGIIHLAGLYQEQTLINETSKTFATTLRPKVWGTWALHQLVQDRPGSLFIHFSSLTSFFGGAMIGAYAAANCFLDTFAHYQRQRGIQSYCFSWSLWNEVGMSRGTHAKDALRARGYQAMTADQGLHSLLAGLRQDTAHLLVGLNYQNSQVRRYTDRSPYPLQQLSAYYSAAAEISDELTVSDRFRTPSTCRLQRVQDMLPTATGEVDRHQLIALGKQSSSQQIAPRTEVERQVAAIWQEILNVSQPSIQDNFFELGGSSLLAVRLLSRLDQTFQVELPPTSLFTSPTIAGLAECIAAASQNQAAPSSPVFLLKPGGDSRPPFFFIPGGGAVDVDFLMYAPLLQAISPQQRVYGLEARRFDAAGKRYTRLEDMAIDYAQDIRAIQPQGPYLLGGECVGGILGVEIARCLKAMGEEVALVALLDSGVPIKDTYRRYRTRKVLKNLNRWVELHVSQFSQSGLWETPVYLLNRLSKKLQKKSSPKTSLPTNLEAEQTRILQTRPQYNAKEKEDRAALIFRHSVQPYPGRLTLLINEARYHERYDQKAGPEWTNHRYRNDPSLGWNQIATEGVALHVLPGNHDTYIREHVQSAAQILEACLEEAIAP